MITINANTKIASLIKHHPDALEAIISVSPKFAKLRNPLLRKLMASRTSIAMASKIGGCRVDDFLSKMLSLGFAIDKLPVNTELDIDVKPEPAFMKNLDADKIFELDVRPVIASGRDPLEIIIKEVKRLKHGFVLKIINSFEPTPLMQLLGKQGFESYTEVVHDELVHTFFYKNTDNAFTATIKENDDAESWEAIAERFAAKLLTIDVRDLEMPLPMHNILDALQTLPNDKALFVYHKRIPVFLLPELEAQQFSYRINEISDGDVHMLIYKN